MSRQDYELIASVIRDVFSAEHLADFTPGELLALTSLKLGKAFEKNNPRFNFDVFLKACLPA